MTKINMSKHIWEGWTVGAFIKELQPLADMVHDPYVATLDKPFESFEQLKAWCMENQPFYKKYIPDVVKYFAARYGIKR